MAGDGSVLNVRPVAIRFESPEGRHATPRYCETDGATWLAHAKSTVNQSAPIVRRVTTAPALTSADASDPATSGCLAGNPVSVFRRRRKPTPGRPEDGLGLLPRANADGEFGRKLSSERSVGECYEHFAALVLKGADDPRVFHPVWTGGAPVPEVLVGVRTGGTEALYLAIWANGSLKRAQREIALVPPGYDGSPIPLPGQWKMLDPSLSSIGRVTTFSIDLPPEFSVSD